MCFKAAVTALTLISCFNFLSWTQLYSTSDVDRVTLLVRKHIVWSQKVTVNYGTKKKAI